MTDPRFPYSRRRHAPAVPEAAAVDARAVEVRYPGEGGAALAGVSLRVGVGARVALVGPNGAGKSTLLRAVAGLLPVRAGEIRVYGLPVGACHHRVAYLPQRSEVDWQFPLTVRRLVLSGRYVHLGWLARPRAADRELVDGILAALGLAALAERQIGQLSGGQQQRALLARALAQDADLLLLDEPFNAVDGETRAVVTELLAALKGKRKTVVVATHDLGRHEGGFDDAVYLAEGRLAPAPGAAALPAEARR